MNEIKSIGANWIAVIPYGFTMLGKPEVHYKEFGGQWWGEKPEGIRKTIQLAHDAGLKVMLKPQVYVPGSWTGSLSFEKKRIGKSGSPVTFPIWTKCLSLQKSLR